MKFLAVFTLFLTAAHGFVVIPNKPITTELAASSVAPKGSSNGKGSLDGIGERYKAKDGSTILGPSPNLSVTLAAMAPLILAINPPAALVGTAGAAFHAALAMWVGVQGNRVRTVFDDEAIEFFNLKGSSSTHLKAKTADDVDPRLERKPDNWLVKGTPNRWKYEKITGYRFYPSLDFPVICILWEKETANIGQQPHFFPALFDAKHFKEEMDKHGVKYQGVTITL